MAGRPRLPEPVRRFCYAAAALQPHELQPWGVVLYDERFPDLWDANNATILEPDLSLEEDAIRRALEPALRTSVAPTEHIEFWETSVRSPALRRLRRSSPSRPRKPDVVMIHERGREPGSRSARGSEHPALVEVRTRPDPGFLAWYRTTLNEFGQVLSEAVLDQLTARTVQVFVPAGLRWFVGTVDGAPAGYSSLVSLDGVGYVDNVVTMPEYRGRGVASATLRRAVQEALSDGARTVFLLAEEGEPPQRLYERLGFRVRGRVESFTRPL